MSDKKKLFGVGSELEESNTELNQQPFKPANKKENAFGSHVQEEAVREKKGCFWCAAHSS